MGFRGNIISQFNSPQRGIPEVSANRESVPITKFSEAASEIH